MSWDQFQFFPPRLASFVIVCVIFVCWVIAPSFWAIRRMKWNRFHSGALICRFLAAVILLLALCQWSRMETESMRHSDKKMGLVLDASQSFASELTRQRVQWLTRTFALDVCVFGSHSEILAESTGASAALGSHRTSRLSTINECIDQLKRRGLQPNQMTVYTDSELSWDVPFSHDAVHWIHEPGKESELDLGIHALLNDQLFFKGTVNKLTVDVLTRGISNKTPLGIYGPRGLIKTIDVEPHREWTPVEIEFTEQDATSLEKRMPLSLRLPKLAAEKNTDNNEVVIFPLWAEHKIKVLHVSGSPSTDTYYLRRWLKAQVNFDVISFYILKDFNDDHSVPQNEISLIPFPVEKLFGSELDKFNVVILQNFEWSSFLQGQLMGRLKEFLRTSGKGLFLIGGPRAFKGRDMSNQDIRSLLPFRDRTPSWDILPSYHEAPERARWVWSEKFPIRESLETGLHFEKYPDVEGVNDLELAPGAVPWAGLQTHPQSPTRWVMASQDSTEGRVLMTITDQMFRWTLEASDLDLGDLYGHFFESALSWLSFNSENVLDRILWPMVSYQGDSFRVSRASSVRVECDGKTFAVEGTTWMAPRSGFCEVTHPRREWVYQFSYPEERTLRAPSPEELTERTRGALVESKLDQRQWIDLFQKTQGVEGSLKVAVTPLWATPWLLVIVIGLVCIDWMCRRRSGLR